MLSAFIAGGRCGKSRAIALSGGCGSLRGIMRRKSLGSAAFILRACGVRNFGNVCAEHGKGQHNGTGFLLAVFVRSILVLFAASGKQQIQKVFFNLLLGGRFHLFLHFFAHHIVTDGH